MATQYIFSTVANRCVFVVNGCILVVILVANRCVFVVNGRILVVTLVVMGVISSKYINTLSILIYSVLSAVNIVSGKYSNLVTRWLLLVMLVVNGCYQ